VSECWLLASLTQPSVADCILIFDLFYGILVWVFYVTIAHSVLVMISGVMWLLRIDLILGNLRAFALLLNLLLQNTLVIGESFNVHIFWLNIN
jgi:hypothetical protein